MKASSILKISAAVAAMALLAISCCTDRNPSGKRTEALPDEAWEQSQWISAANAPVITGEVKGRENNRSADGASWFLCSNVNEKKVTKAVWMTTSLGVNEVFVNGRRVGQEVLKPGFTHPYKTRISFTYDVTSMMDTKKDAENVFSAVVLPGWWGDKIVTPGGHDGMVGKKCAFRSVLALTYSDGTTALVGTDTEKWTAGIAGPVGHAGIFDGEEYDARVKPGYETPELLSEPEVNTEFEGEIVPSVGAEIHHRDDKALLPVEAYTWCGVEGEKEGEYGKVVKKASFVAGETINLDPGDTLVVDFGQNCAGVPEFEFAAEEGTVLTFLPGEILNDGNGAVARGMDGPEGSCHRTNLRVPDTFFKAVYTFADSKGAFVTYRPRFTFFGYRYASVAADGPVTIKSIKSIPVTSIAENLETGRITTGSELINKLISNTYWGQLSNYLSVPTDCPQRDERLGWMADTQVFTEAGTFFANTAPFFHKWTRDVRDSQSEKGGFPGVSPLAQYGGEMMRLGWADAGVIVPWTVWKQFGDNAIADENWEAMDKFITYVNETKYDHNAHIEENYNYQWADWLSYEALESNGGGAFEYIDDVRKPKADAIVYWNYLSACYWALDADMIADMAASTGRDEEKYRSMACSACDYIKEQFMTPEGTFKTEILNTMQTPALFALKLGLVDGEAKTSMCERLRQNFAEHEGCLQTGFLGTSILMQVLSDNGMSDIAWDLLFQRKNPSWLYSVDNGATTIWERWNSYTLEKGMGPKGMNSFNHYAYGCVCQWIWETAAGICADPAVPGFKHIIMSPVPDKRLGSLEAEYDSAAGTIKSAWRYEGDQWIWKFTVPKGATATVTLPGQTESKEYKAGSYTVKM